MLRKVYVILTKDACNANCKFCITKTKQYGDRPQLLLPNKAFIDTLKKLQRMGVSRFELTGGGEPLLNEHYQEIINLIREYFPHAYIKFYTNGYRCLPITNIDELNISAVGLEQLQVSHVVNTREYKELLTILKYYQNEKYKKRISLLLVKNAIDSPAKLQDFIEKTSVYVDEYVVRTAYIGTPFYEELHTDFEYSHPKITWEKDMCSCQSNDTAILFTDSYVYSDWFLNHPYKENEKFDQLMLIKPDMQTYFDKFLEYLEEKGIEIKKVYQLSNFCEDAQVFYKNFKTPTYFKNIVNHLKVTSELFGNTGLILQFKDKENIRTLLEEVKAEFRERYAFSKNYNKYILYRKNEFQRDNAKFIDIVDDAFDKRDYGVNLINLLHLPDEDEVKTLWLLLRDENYFATKQPLNAKQLQLMTKYHTFYLGE